MTLFFLSFGLLIPKIRRRVLFELQNLEDKKCDIKNFDPEVGFEVSSEGEFEQVRPLIEDLLKQKRKMQIIYSSESLQRQINELSRFEEVRSLRLPLLTYNPWVKALNPTRWLKAEKFFLVRYDFFPELFLYGMKSNVKFYLLWGTLKGKKKNFDFLRRQFFSQFNHIIAATEGDAHDFKQRLHLTQVSFYDFRIEAITRRLMAAEEKLELTLGDSQGLKELLELFPHEKRVILGSYWDDEPIEIEELTAKGYLVVILPHNLKNEKREDKFYHFESQKGSRFSDYLDPIFKLNRPIVLWEKGILCELYPYFGHAYVGGGFRSSVHSLLEPFLSGCHVYFGPKVHRSTEFDLAMEFDQSRMHQFDSLRDFPSRVMLSSNSRTNKEKIGPSFSGRYKMVFDSLF